MRFRAAPRSQRPRRSRRASGATRPCCEAHRAPRGTGLNKPVSWPAPQQPAVRAGSTGGPRRAHRAERTSPRGLCARTRLQGPGLTEVWLSPCVKRAASSVFLPKPFSSRAKCGDLGPEPRPQPPLCSHDRSSVVHVPLACPVLTLTRAHVLGAGGSSPPTHGGGRGACTSNQERLSPPAGPTRSAASAAEPPAAGFSSRVRVRLSCRPLNKAL